MAACVCGVVAVAIWAIGMRDARVRPGVTANVVPTTNTAVVAIHEVADTPDNRSEPETKPPVADDVDLQPAISTNQDQQIVLKGVGGDPEGVEPQDRDENFSLLTSAEIVKRLAQSKDKIELRKAAQVLGDRAIAGTLTLSAEERAAVLKAAQHYLDPAVVAGSSDEEAKEQLDRLWWPAAPALVDHVADPNLRISDLAVQGLSLMRNEAIVRALVEKARAATEKQAKEMYIFALGCMTEQYDTVVLRRTCMNEKESELLADKLIRPFLEQQLKTETDPAMQGIMTKALADLKQAADHRPREVSLEELNENVLRSVLASMEKAGDNPEMLEKYRDELKRRQRLREQK